MRYFSEVKSGFAPFRCLIAAILALASAPALADSALPCKDRPTIEYQLGPKSDIDKLYPMIKTDSMSAYDFSMAVASNIQFYLQDSLNRDQIDACWLAVTPDGDAGYKVSFHASSSKAADYAKNQPAWLEHGKLGLKGAVSCQNDASCWEPKGEKLKCSGPWQFYLPLGLPMVAQKMVMLLHYPPYSAMQQSDYLNNATLNRWQRLLVTVGVPVSDWTLYTTTVDIFPIAAPGSGQTGCFPTTSATNFFGDKGSQYIPKMLDALVLPSTTPAGKAKATIPVIIYGSEAIGYWNATYPGALAGVLKGGTVNLNPAEPTKKTPFMGANHPIAAVYQTCSSTPGTVAMAKQDLATACFARTMASAISDVDAVSVAKMCELSYTAPPPESEYASQVCVTAVIDKSPQFAQWTTAQAKTWCDAHRNNPCPLPDY